MHISGESNSKTDDLLEDILQAIEGLSFKQEPPIVNMEYKPPAILLPEQKAPVMAEQKAPIVNNNIQVRKLISVRFKIVKDSYGGIDYIDAIPLP